MRPPTFFQQCRDQQWYIHQLQALQSGYAAQINELKDKLIMQTKHHQHQPRQQPPRQLGIAAGYAGGGGGSV